jgi:hypothetical protein
MRLTRSATAWNWTLLSTSQLQKWSKVGGYCDISDWLSQDCEITQGDGGIGTVRVLNGTIVEPMVAQTELSYGYTQPVTEGEYYKLYHGFMEARPVTAKPRPDSSTP